MAFWKKSEDPWDIDPEKRRSAPAVYEQDGQAPENDAPGLLDSLKSWVKDLGDGGVSSAKAETAAPPEKCPWCGGDMELGHFSTGKQLWWVPGGPTTKSKWLGADPKICLRVDDEGVIFTYKTVWYCRACEKMTIDAAGMQPPYGSDGFDSGWDGATVVHPGVEEDETQE